MARLSEELQSFFFAADRLDRVTVTDILQLSQERTFGLLFVLLSLPSALPIPAPGYSIPFGLVILLLSVQLVAGSRIPWLPLRVMKASLGLNQVQQILGKGLPWLRRLEALSRPRFSWICTSFVGRIIMGGAISLMGISMMIPVPGTNTLPAIGIFVSGFGLIEDDGVISVMGILVCLVAGILSISILLALWLGGTSLLDQILELIRSS